MSLRSRCRFLAEAESLMGRSASRVTCLILAEHRDCDGWSPGSRVSPLWSSMSNSSTHSWRIDKFYSPWWRTMYFFRQKKETVVQRNRQEVGSYLPSRDPDHKHRHHNPQDDVLERSTSLRASSVEVKVCCLLSSLNIPTLSVNHDQFCSLINLTADYATSINKYGNEFYEHSLQVVCLLP